MFLSGDFSLPSTHLLSSRWTARPAGPAWPQLAFRTAGSALTPLWHTDRCSWLFCTPVSIFPALQASRVHGPLPSQPPCIMASVSRGGFSARASPTPLPSGTPQPRIPTEEPPFPAALTATCFPNWHFPPPPSESGGSMPSHMVLLLLGQAVIGCPKLVT